MGRAYYACSQETAGIPWKGAPGVSESVAQIMAREELARAKPKTIRLKKEREGPERDRLPQNPASPRAARWVPDLSIADSVQTSTEVLAPQTPDVNFTGATLADTHAFPPDSMGAVGPSQFVVFVNGRLRTFNKATGTADGVLNVDPDVFFASVTTPVGGSVLFNFTSDPQVRYDRLSGRWFLTIIDVPCTDSNCTTTAANRLLIAVSDTGSITPSTAWTFYFFQGDPGTNFLDYPSLGVDANALYIGANMFNSSGTSFLGCNAYVVRKSSVLSGGPIVVTKFAVVSSGTAAGPYSPRGVDNYDPASNQGYFIGVNNATFGTLMLRRVSNPGGTPTVSSNIAITVSSTSFPIPVDHLGNTGGNNGRLDALDDRLFAAHVRNGRLWTAHNIKVNSSGVGANMGGQLRDGVRWYELNVPVGSGTPTVVQSGTIFDNVSSVSNARQFWVPTVMVSGQGHAALGFSTAGTPYRANAGTAGRLATDTLGTLQTFANYTASTTAYNPTSDPGDSSGRRWGDYSFVSLDPNDDMTMWTIQEFCDSADSYGVRVVKLLAPLPATPTTCNPSIVTQGVSNIAVVLTGTSSSGSGFFDPGTSFPNHLSAAVNGGSVTVNTVTYNNRTNLTLNLTVAAGATTGARTITVTNPDGQSVTSASGILTIAGLPEVNFSFSVNKIGAGTGTVTSSPVGIDCGGTCTVSFASNTVVTLTPTAGANSAFRGWSGGCSSTGDCSVTMSSNTIRTANFDALPVITNAFIGPSSPTTTNDLIAAVFASDADGDPITFAYQWQQSTNDVSFGNIAFTSDSLLASATIAGDFYRVLVTPNDGVAAGQTFTTGSLLVPVDADGNGLNDDWEVANFGHLGVDANADADGDGFNNAQEFAAGTDPNDGTSALSIIAIGTDGGHFVISFTTVGGKSYDLQRSDDITSGIWTMVATNIAGTGGIVQATDVGGASLPDRHYRVRLSP
jgi:hypothetical protein